MLQGSAGKEISEEEGNISIIPSSFGFEELECQLTIGIFFHC